MNHVTGLLFMSLAISAACGSSGQVRISDIELWLPPGAVTMDHPVIRPGEQNVTFWVTARPVSLSESIVSHCNAHGLRQDEIHAWAPLPSSGIVLEPGVRNRPVHKWTGSWKDSEGNTIFYALHTQAADLDTEAYVAGHRMVMPALRSK
jgi:hypothetical protein